MSRHEDDSTPMVPFVRTKISIPRLARPRRRKRPMLKIMKKRARARPKPSNTADPSIAEAPRAKKVQKTQPVKRVKMEFSEPPKPAASPLFIEFKEENGWEKKTWRVYIPYAPNKKLLPGLSKICKFINFHNGIDEAHRKRHAEWEARTKERAEEYVREFKISGDPLNLALANHVREDLQHGMPCVGCTKFSVDSSILYTEAECHIRVKSLGASCNYMSHAIFHGSKLDRNKLNCLAKLLRTKDPEKRSDAFQTLYKGGIKDMFV